MKKKILFMLCTWQESYAQVVMSGVEKAVKDLDVEMHVLNAYGSEVEYFTKEVEAFLLADVRKYDGVMMLFNGVGTVEYLEKYTAECVKYHVPAISIDLMSPGIAYCGIDSYRSMYNITEHLIKEHQVTRLHYIGGPDDHPDSIERGQAFLDCLKDHNLEPYGFSYYGFMRSSGRKAYEDIKASGREFAEAYVCANDYGALGFCYAAKEDGLEPPKDFLITGFDHLVEGMNYFPSISSIDRNLEGIGQQSLLHLMDIIEGKVAGDSQKCIPGNVVEDGSCGCGHDRNISAQYLELYNSLMERNKNDTLQKGARERLCGNDTFEQYQEELRQCISKKGLVDFRVALNKDIFWNECSRNVGYNDELEVYGANTHVSIRREDGLIPDEFRDDTTKIYWFGTLHCKEKTLGYSIFKYFPTMLDFQYHRTINETAALAVENIRQAMILHEMNQKLESLYIKDSLTGLYNRFGYNTFAGSMYKENNGRIYIVFIDMDGLKVLNDTYGHDMGDLALKGIAEAMKTVYTDTDIKVRMGGDEFLVVGPYVDEEELCKKEKKVSEYLVEYSKRVKLPIPLEVSMGHSHGEGFVNMDCTGLEAILRKADANMYELKQTKKNHR